MENLLSLNEDELFPVYLAGWQKTGTFAVFISTGTAKSRQQGGPDLLATALADLIQHTQLPRGHQTPLAGSEDLAKLSVHKPLFIES